MPRRIAALICLWLALTGCGQETQSLKLAVTTEEPAPTIAETVKGTLVASGFDLSIQTATNPADTVDAIRQGTIDLAIIEEPERALPGIATLAPLYPSVLHVLHREDVQPANFKALIAGADVYAGPAGGTAYRLLMQFAADAGLGAEDYVLLDNPWTQSPDVYFVLGGLLSGDSIEQLADYRLYNFRSSDDVDGGSIAHGIALRHHQLQPFLLPRGVYPALTDKAVLTLSIRTVLIASENLASEVAYDISANLFTSAQEIALSYPLVTRELDEDLRTVALMLPLHPGARRFLDRDAPGFVERYVDLLALYFTIFLTLLSGSIAIYRYRSQVRKDRVDSYFQQLLDVRKALDGGHGRTECRQKVLAVQHEVLELLIDERVAADASLVAFISLSNQLLTELGGK